MFTISLERVRTAYTQYDVLAANRYPLTAHRYPLTAHRYPLTTNRYPLTSPWLLACEGACALLHTAWPHPRQLGAG